MHFKTQNYSFFGFRCNFLDLFARPSNRVSIREYVSIYGSQYYNSLFVTGAVFEVGSVGKTNNIFCAIYFMLVKLTTRFKRLIFWSPKTASSLSRDHSLHTKAALISFKLSPRSFTSECRPKMEILFNTVVNVLK